MAYLKLVLRSLLLSFVFMGFGLFSLVSEATTTTPTPPESTTEPTPTITIVPTDTVEPTPTLTPTSITLDSPSGLSATADSDSSISLSWELVEGADTYEVYRADALVAIVSTNSYIDRNLDAETLYLYKIRAAKGGVYSVFTSNVGATTFEEESEEPEEEEPEVTPTVEPTEAEEVGPTIVIDHSFDKVTINGSVFGYSDVLTVTQDDDVTISGKATEGSVVELIFGSSFTNPTTTVDETGIWEIVVDTEDLLFGENVFTVKVVNSEGDSSFESEEITLDFEEEGSEDEEVEVTPTVVDESNNISSSFENAILMIVGVILIVVGVLIFVGWKKGWHHKLFKEEELDEEESGEDDDNDPQQDGEESKEEEVSIGKDRTGLENKAKKEENNEEIDEESKSAEDIAAELSSDEIPEEIDIEERIGN